MQTMVDTLSDLSIYHTLYVNFGGNHAILHNICDPNYCTSINSSCVHSKFSVISVSMATYSKLDIGPVHMSMVNLTSESMAILALV